MEWISVKDSLPKSDQCCVVYNSSRVYNFYIATYSKFFNEFEVYTIGYTRLYDPITFNATHWMPLSSPKKDE